MAGNLATHQTDPKTWLRPPSADLPMAPFSECTPHVNAGCSTVDIRGADTYAAWLFVFPFRPY